MKAKLILIFMLVGVILTACTAGNIEPNGAVEPSETPSENSLSESPPASNSPPTPQPTTDYNDLEIITLLPRDAIPAIDDPNFLTVEEADKQYDPDELVIGVEFNGDARAYSIPFLSGHEIVNDTVGGVALSVTW